MTFLTSTNGRYRAKILRVLEGIAYIEMWPARGWLRERFALPAKFLKSKACGWKPWTKEQGAPVSRARGRK